MGLPELANNAPGIADFCVRWNPHLADSMSQPNRISFGFILLVLVLAGWLNMGALLLSVLTKTPSKSKRIALIMAGV